MVAAKPEREENLGPARSEHPVILAQLWTLMRWDSLLLTFPACTSGAIFTPAVTGHPERHKLVQQIFPQSGQGFFNISISNLYLFWKITRKSQYILDI